MRTFQFSDAKSHKFWNIDVQGKSFTVTFGKIGTAGQTKTKEFADAYSHIWHSLGEEFRKGQAA